MPKKYLVALFLLAYVLPVSLHAAHQKSFLWKIDNQKPAYLFGSIHLPDPQVNHLPPSALKAFNQADTVFTEIALEPGIEKRQADLLKLPNNQKLEDLVPVSLIKRMDKLLQTTHQSLSTDILMHLKVWAAASALSTIEQQLRYPTLLPLDMLIYQKAANLGKRVGGLETLEEQISIFDNFPKKEQIQILEGTVQLMEKSLNKGEHTVDSLVKWYLAGDITSFGEKMKTLSGLNSPSLSKKFFKKVLTDRNKTFAERIDKKISNNPKRIYFFVIGAGHFYGKQSIQNLLRDKGYKVERIE